MTSGPLDKHTKVERERTFTQLLGNIPAYMKLYGNVVSYTAHLIQLENQPESESNNPDIRREYANALLMTMDAYRTTVPKDIRSQVLEGPLVKMIKDYCEIVLDGKKPKEINPSLIHALKSIAPD